MLQFNHCTKLFVSDITAKNHIYRQNSAAKLFLVYRFKFTIAVYLLLLHIFAKSLLHFGFGS